MESNNKKSLSLREVAEELGVSIQTVRRLLKRGVLRSIPSLGVHRIPRTELDNLVGGVR